MTHDYHDRDMIDLPGCLYALAMHKWFILAISTVAFLITLAFSLCLDNSYTATVKFVPVQQNQSPLTSLVAQASGAGNILGALLPTSSSSDLYAEMLKSDQVKDAIVTKHKLVGVYEVAHKQDAYRELMKNVQINVGKEGIVSVAVDDDSPQRAADIANGFLAELENMALSMSLAQAGQSSAFLEKKLAASKEDLRIAEDNLKAFQAKNNVVNVPDQFRMTVEAIAQLKGQLAAQEVQLGMLRQKYTDENAEVKSAKASIASIKSQISGLDARGGESALPALREAPSLGQEYLRLMRELKSQEAIVTALTSQYQMARIGATSTLSPIQVVQRAMKPERKSKPKRGQMVLVVTGATFVLAICYVFMRERAMTLPDAEKRRWLEALEQLKLRKRS